MAIFRKMIVHSGVSPSATANVVSMDSTQYLQVKDVMQNEAADSTFMDNNNHTYS